MILLDEIEVGFEQKHRKEKEKVRLVHCYMLNYSIHTICWPPYSPLHPASSGVASSVFPETVAQFTRQPFPCCQ